MLCAKSFDADNKRDGTKIFFWDFNKNTFPKKQHFDFLNKRDNLQNVYFHKRDGNTIESFKQGLRRNTTQRMQIKITKHLFEKKNHMVPPLICPLQ